MSNWNNPLLVDCIFAITGIIINFSYKIYQNNPSYVVKTNKMDDIIQVIL